MPDLGGHSFAPATLVSGGTLRHLADIASQSVRGTAQAKAMKSRTMYIKLLALEGWVLIDKWFSVGLDLILAVGKNCLAKQ